MVPSVTPVNGRHVRVTDDFQRPQAAPPNSGISASHRPSVFMRALILYSTVVQLRPTVLGGLSRAGYDS